MSKINWAEYYESTVIPSFILAGLSVFGKSSIDGTMLPQWFPFLFLFFLVVITLSEGYDKIKARCGGRGSTTLDEKFTPIVVNFKV